MSCKCDLNDKLEAERLDVTFREPKPPLDSPCSRPHFTCSKPHNPVCQREHLTQANRDELTKLYFNAGRYAAGARDSVAVSANDLVWAELAK